MLANKEKFEKDMAVFSFKQHQDFLTYSNRLSQFGYTISDVENYVSEQKNAMGKAMGEVKPASLVKCPKCGAPMTILPVNDKPGTQTGDDSKSVMICRQKDCMHTEYSAKTVNELIKEISKK